MHALTLIGALFIVGFITGAKVPSKCTPSKLYPNVDINYFNFCDPKTGELSTQKCGDGLGFVRNKTTSGCVPFDKMPKQCTPEFSTPPMCIGNNLVRPSPAVNPNQYYICDGEGSEPILMNCPEGKGFLNIPGTIGCANFSVWRSMKDCPE